LLPRSLITLSTRVGDGSIVPHYLTERDEPWLRALLDEHARYVGRKRSELEDRLREPLAVPSPKAKLRVAIHVLDVLGRDRTTAPVLPREARWSVFRAASASRAPRDVVLCSVGQSLGVTPDELEASLFADLRGERRVAALPARLSPSTLALEANRAIVSSLLTRASHVRISVWGNTRALVRHTRLMGLICVLSTAKNAPTRIPSCSAQSGLAAGSAGEGVVLDISGPFALFRHTEVYGRALASLVPRAAWCNRFEIAAACVLGRGSDCSTFVVRSGDPIGAGRELPPTTVSRRSGLRRIFGVPRRNGTWFENRNQWRRAER
jgi:predicted nuclease of restriction endonuclease-like RecB superfamily